MTNDYDNFAQLLTVTTDLPGSQQNPDPVVFDYDDNGNRVAGTAIGSYNRLLHDADRIYGYDAEGNLTSRWSFGSQAVGDVLSDEQLWTAEAHTWSVGRYRLDFDNLRFEDGTELDTTGTYTLTADVYLNDWGGDTLLATISSFTISWDATISKWVPDLSDTLWFDVDAEQTSEMYVEFNYTSGLGYDPDVSAGSVFHVSRRQGVEHFTWDHRNRLTSVTRHSSTGEGPSTQFTSPEGTTVTWNEVFEKVYAYDVHNQLIGEDVTYWLDNPVSEDPDVVTESKAFVNERSHRVVEFVEGDVLRIKLWGPGVDELLAVEATTDGLVARETYWPLADHLGSVNAIHCDGETQLGSEQPFGQPSNVDPFTQTLPTTSFFNILDVRHASREFDPDTGLYYNRARWYDALAGRFISEDAWGFFAGDPNLYRYAANSPTNATDPSGHVIETPWDIASIVVGIGSVGYDIYHIATTGEGWGDLGMDLFGLGVDVLAAFVPFVPGGVSIANRAVRAGHKAVSVGRKVDTGINAYQTGQSAIASYDAFQQGDVWAGSLNLVGAGLGGSHFAIRGVAGAKRFAQNYEIVMPATRNLAGMPSMGGLSILTEAKIQRRGGASMGAPRVTPQSLGAKSIVEDARLHRFWEDSIKELYSGTGKTGKPLRAYLDAVESGVTPTAKQARSAFDSVNRKFLDKVDDAIAKGAKFDGFGFDDVHHWNWKMKDNPYHALDPRNLFPANEELHKLIHRRVTVGPHPYTNGVDPLNRLDLDFAYPLAPG